MQSKIPDLFKHVPDDDVDPWYRVVRDRHDMVQVKERINSMWSAYYRLGLADRHFLSEFPRKFCHRWWELEVACFLLDNGFELRSADSGPDFICQKDSSRVYVECVVCEAGNIDSPDFPAPLYPDVAEGTVDVIDINLPEQERVELLRIRNAIENKVTQYHKHLESGLIQRDIPYVIALSPVLLPDLIADEENMPGVIKAVYPVGNIFLSIDPSTGKTLGGGRSLRSSIIKSTNAPVHTNVFLPEPENARYKGVAGILYSYTDFRRISGSARILQNGHSFIFVHNLATANGISVGFFGERMDFWVELASYTYIVRNNNG